MSVWAAQSHQVAVVICEHNGIQGLKSENVKCGNLFVLYCIPDTHIVLVIQYVNCFPIVGNHEVFDGAFRVEGSYRD